ncbi:Rieske 2Fe-2S domain-containing protein [Pendulispora albinea]|uniref:Rieske 2Fe-2S domain-containing protein n=1 Tax=Pendulispora albinea TaxID=2741071 RepID=A0ABZ2MAL2_9BACT
MNAELNELTTKLSASWYVAMLSKDLKSTPVAVKLFGEELVAWRDARGVPVVMDRYCSHLGASLADGKVVDGCIQCPFHHWRFDATGGCAHIPGHQPDVPRLVRIPSGARQRIYATAERYGYIWVWYGSQAPQHPLPEVPTADVGRPDHMVLRVAYDTRTTVLRIVENFYDAQHAAPVHALPITAFDLKVFDASQASPEFAGMVKAGAWFGGSIEFKVSRYFGAMGMFANLIGLNMSRMYLTFDGYPGGCLMSVTLDNEEKYKLLQCVTPVDTRENVMHALIAIPRRGRFRDLANYVLFGLQTKSAAGADVQLWNAMKPDGGGAFSRYDSLVLKYRSFYKQWVDRVGREPATPSAPEDMPAARSVG